MALSEYTAFKLAASLQEAERTRIQVTQFSLLYPNITVEDAYAVQREFVRLKIAEGREPIGHKIGLPSRAIQRSSNIAEAHYGMLLDDMLFRNGAEIPFKRFIAPSIEVVLSFILKANLNGPHCTVFDVLKATDYVVPALEIVDARIQQVDPATNTTRKVFDTISDNAANGGIVLGGRPIKPLDVDLRRASAVLYRNENIEESGFVAAVFNHPANGLVWLANKLHSLGVELRAGQIILGGSFTAPVSVRPGDAFYADYGEFGSITCSFDRKL